MSAASKVSPEIWLNIGQYLYSFREQAALARVNRMLYGIFQVDLYSQAVEESYTEITVLAAAKGNLDTLKVAAAFGADLNRVYSVPIPSWNYEGTQEPMRIPCEDVWATPLHMAVQNEHEQVVRWLVHEQKVDVNSPGRFLCQCMAASIALGKGFGRDRRVVHRGSYPAWTPLHLAICLRHVSIARELLANGGSHDTLIAREDLPAFKNGAWKIVPRHTRRTRERIRAKDYWATVDGVKLTHVAAMSGSNAIMTFVVRDFGGDVNAEDGSGATPLHYAILAKDEGMVRHLLALGANPSRQYLPTCERVLRPGDIRWGPLDLALRHEPSVARIFLENGVSVWTQEFDEGLVESSLHSVLRESAYRSVPPALPLFLELTREQERQRDLSSWVSFDFVSAEEEIQTAFYHACNSPAFDVRDLEAFIDQGELYLGSVLKFEPTSFHLPSRRCAGINSASRDWELLRFDTTKNSVLSLALCLAVRVIRPRYNAYATVRWLLDKGASPTIELHGGVTTSVLAILLKQMDYTWAAFLRDPPINWEQNPLRDIAHTISLLGDRGAWSPAQDGNAMGNLRTEFRHALDRLFPREIAGRSFTVQHALARGLSEFQRDCGMYWT